MIEIQLEQQAIAAGDDLCGTVMWQSDRNKIPKQVRISIGWYSEGRGTRDREEIGAVSLDPNAVAAGDYIPFSLKVPYEGPVSYDGNLLRIIWELKVWVDLPGIFARDDKQTWPFQVIPRQSTG